MILILLNIFFFFFQAEDGIRDAYVTGVQTCALPILDKIVKKVNKEFEKTSVQIEGLITDALNQFDHLQHQVQDPVRKLLKDMDELRRSEERRVGKECRSRWSRYQ